MRAEDLFPWLLRKPFVPLRLTLSDGRTFDATARECVAFWTRDTLMLSELDPDFSFPVLGDKRLTVPLDLIAAVEPLSPTATG